MFFRHFYLAKRYKLLRNPITDSQENPGLYVVFHCICLYIFEKALIGHVTLADVSDL